MKKIKYCPFCHMARGESKYSYSPRYGGIYFYYVECPICKAHGPLIKNKEFEDCYFDSAEEAWGIEEL